MPKRFKLAESLEAAAREFPNRTTLVAAAQLQAANDLAARLAPGERVGVLLGQSLDIAIAHYAIFRAELVAVPTGRPRGRPPGAPRRNRVIDDRDVPYLGWR